MARRGFVVLLATVFAACLIQPAAAADAPDLIFKKSTVFKWLTPNDKLTTYGIDDPIVEGVACHFTVPERRLQGLDRRRRGSQRHFARLPADRADPFQRQVRAGR
jgi:catabolite regulation protein CreA